jgi:hypothetical protein
MLRYKEFRTDYLPVTRTTTAEVFFTSMKASKIFRAGQRGKMHNVIRHVADFASHFFSRSQVQLNSLAGLALKDAEDGQVKVARRFFSGRANWNR